MDGPLPGHRGSGIRGSEAPLALHQRDQRRQRALDVGERVAERPRRVDTGQLLAHAPAADHRDDTGLSDRIPSTRLIPDLLDWWDQAVPVRTNHRQRCRQRATERILGLHRNRSRLLDDDRLCHWITRPILDIPAGDAASNSSVPARERPGR